SKSLGNQYTLSDLLERGVAPRSLRYLFLSVHYRQKLNFTFPALEAADNALRRLDEMRYRLDNAEESADASTELAAAAETMETEFRQALANDLNVSAALAALFGLVKRVNVAVEQGPLARGDRELLLTALAAADRVLGVLDPAAWDGEGESDDDAAEIEALLDQRQAARREKDFATADRLRDELEERGIVIEDTPEGTRWRRR
ncbi:MAG: DALR domain-containing protein, partial [Thermoanaerobaculia bacterium]|nr:DALR domain-containing protein [Thermoanaerobaculia bacterium]